MRAYYREDHYAPIRETYVEMVAKQLKNAKLAADDEQAEAQAQAFPRRGDAYRGEPLGQCVNA